MSAGGYGAAASMNGSGLRIGIVATRWNAEIVGRLVDGARRGLAACSVDSADVIEVLVPGAFEIPLAASTLAASGNVDTVITLGAVIRGDTPHFEYVCGPCADGVMRAQLDTGVPVLFGVLTVNTAEQADERTRSVADGGVGNKGEEAAWGAVEMALLMRTLRTTPRPD